MRRSLRRLALAFAASAGFHVLAVVTGDAGIGGVLTPMLLIAFVQLELSPHDSSGFVLAIGLSILFYGVVFWTVGTISNMVAELVGGLRERRKSS